jgi:hypothetical protein
VMPSQFINRTFAVSPPTWRRCPHFCPNELREEARNIQ